MVMALLAETIVIGRQSMPKMCFVLWATGTELMAPFKIIVVVRDCNDNP